MKYILLASLIFSLFGGCSHSNEVMPIKVKHTDIFSDHKIISNKKIIASEIEDLLKNELNKKELSPSFYRDTWVYAIKSTFRWPNSVEVKLKEHQPLASWEGTRYLTQSGLIISPSESNLELLLVNLGGPEDKKFRLLSYSRKIQSQLSRYGQIIAEVEINSEGYIKATSITGVSFIFSEKDFRDQLERLENFISFELISGRLNNIKNMDLRYKNGISVLF